jgi:hypothetical protein
MKLVVSPVGANLFNVLTFISLNGEYQVAIPRQSSLTFGGAVKFIFDAVNAVDTADSTKPIAYVSAKENEQEETDLDDFLRECSPGFVPAEKMKNGKPVRLFENKQTADASRPYEDTLGGKVLKWIPELGGAVFVDKKDLPPEKFLSNSPNGIVMVEGKANVSYRRPMFKGFNK